MDPIALTVGALTAGALESVGAVSGAAVRDAYARLKNLVAARLPGGPVVLEAWEAPREDTSSLEAGLTLELRRAGLDADAAVVAAAQRVMALVDAEGARRGKYVVDLRGNQGTVVGDHNQQIIIFAAPRGREVIADAADRFADDSRALWAREAAAALSRTSHGAG